MKKIISIYALFLFVIIFAGCKKNDATPDFKCTTCKTIPDALAANDASSKGVYKGIIIGSTGTIQFNIANGNSTINAIMVLDGVTVNLTASVVWTAGTAYVSAFTGTLNGTAVSITFKVDYNGANPIVVSFNIPGHTTAQFNIIKETSLSLLECFEGTYSTTKPQTGTFNILVARSLGKMGGSSRKTDGTSNGDFGGTINASGEIFNDSGLKMGTISGDKLTGTFKDSDNNTVTIEAKRTL